MSLIGRFKAFLNLLRQLFCLSGRPTSTLHPPTSKIPESSQRSTSALQQDARDVIPRGSWDSHMHIVNPAEYPLASGALYTPSPFTLAQCQEFEALVGLDNVVIVQPSIYGDDNGCLLDALRTLGPSRARGVVSFEPGTVASSTIQEWHTLGVRGVRLNLSSVGMTMTAGELRTLLERYAMDLRQTDGWVLQLYIPMSMIPLLERMMPLLDGLRVCIDHMGHPDIQAKSTSGDPYNIPGFHSLVRLLKAGNTFVKLSAPYRLAKDYNELETLGKELLRVAGRSRVVFATDWPHTRFEGLDIQPWVRLVLQWCEGDKMLVERLFKGNAEDLWSV